MGVDEKNYPFISVVIKEAMAQGMIKVGTPEECYDIGVTGYRFHLSRLIGDSHGENLSSHLIKIYHIQTNSFGGLGVILGLVF